MVEVSMKTAAATERPQSGSARAKRLERLERIKEALEHERVLVEPKNEAMRRVLKSSEGGGFRASGPAEWPLDSFTRRRLADGSIRRVEEEKREESEQR